MKNIGKRVIATLGVSAILGTSLFAGALAAGTDIKGKIMKMNIFSNGAAITIPQDQQPIIVNNRTYLPVRALGEALGKKVDWNQNDPNSVYISGGVDENQFNQMALDLNQTRLQVAERDTKIKNLEAQVKNLEEELKKKDDKGSTVKEFENYLNRTYGDYERLRFDIRLSEKSKKYVVDIDVNKSYYTDWAYLSTSKQEKLISDVVYEIQREYKYPQIDGYVNAGTSSESYEFYTDSKDKLQIGRRSGSGSDYNRGDFGSLERYIIGEYTEVYDILINESGYDIIAKVELDRNSYSSSQLQNLRNRLRGEIDWELNRSTKYNIYVDFYYNGSTIDLDN